MLCCVMIFYTLRRILILTLTSHNLLAAPLVVYGTDDRVDIRDAAYKYQVSAQSVAAQIPKNHLEKRMLGPYQVTYKETLRSFFRLERNQRFAQQQVGVGCSAFLVSPKIIATAGHCVQSTQDCNSNYWVFDYQLADGQNRIDEVKKENVVTCKRIIKTQLDYQTDFALIEINETQSRPFLELEDSIQENQQIYMLGFPSGLPMKLTNNANIMDIFESSFKANLDAFSLNSGSPVLSEKSDKVIGILINGTQDYIKGSGSRNIVNTCLNDATGCAHKDGSAGEGVSRVNQFIHFVDQSI